MFNCIKKLCRSQRQKLRDQKLQREKASTDCQSLQEIFDRNMNDLRITASGMGYDQLFLSINKTVEQHDAGIKCTVNLVYGMAD